ncbi:benzoquinone reductase [Sphaerobolus stellatus SS14]|uniref:Benzoquinone reductase n=1 Tax=Sphaerobolus stellatus (strain SS14) TaxID=990650 RepID=A0A0C9UME8_SPHS4|nr:benzoquinone reductase [Sphaerobolus stellatus SS14]
MEVVQDEEITESFGSEVMNEWRQEVAIIIYSIPGHITALVEAEKKGIEEARGSATIYQIPETLPQEILSKMHAPAKPDYSIINVAKLPESDAFLFGIPTITKSANGA